MKNETTKRISYIAQAQLIGCALVILGHSIPLNWEVPNLIFNIDVFIYTFHMPLFFFVSGYLFEKTNSANRYKFKEYITKRAYRLMFPYVVLTLVGFFPKFLTENVFGDGASLSLDYIVKSFLVPRQNVWGHFWFLPTLLLISIFAFFFSNLKNAKNKFGFVLVVIILFILPIIPILTNITDWFGINDVIKFTCYYAFGILFANSKLEQLFCNGKWNKLLLLLFPISIGLFLIKNDNAILIKIVREIVGILMILFVLALAKQFDIIDTKVGSFLTKKTYSIFILSWPFQSVVSIIFENMLGLKYYITMPIAFVLGISGPIAVIIMVDWLEKKIGKKIISPIIGG